MIHSDNLDGTFTNPILMADYPDPDIIAVGDDYYMVSSTFTVVPGIPICHSTDLINWKIIGHAYDRLPASNPAYSIADGLAAYRGGSWAPCIRHNAGKFYVCFCTPAEGFHMCIADRPEGPYEMTAFGTELYDPGLLFDDDGGVYVFHGANGLLLTELTADVRAIKSPAVNVCQTAFGTPLEGSHAYKRNGFYYLCVTSRGYNGIQIVLRSSHILGPWESRVICADDMNYANAGLHQGGFVETPHSETWFFMFQDRDWLGRLPVLQPVRWVDDWPTLGDPDNYGKAYVTTKKPKTSKPMPPAIPEASDRFDAPNLGLQWQWNHNPDDSKWSLSERPGFLRLRASTGPDLMHTRNTLTQKIVGPRAIATVTVDAASIQDGEMAGLATLNFAYAFVAVSQTKGQRTVVMVNEGKTIASASLSSDQTVVRLRADVDDTGVARFAWAVDDTFRAIGDELALQFTVKTFLGNRFGLFCNAPAGASAGGHADFGPFVLNDLHPAHRFPAQATIPAVAYDDERGTDTQRPTEKSPRQYLINIDPGDWIVFNQIDFGQGVDRFDARVSPIGRGGTISLHVDDFDSPPVGVCRADGIGSTDWWNGPFVTASCPLQPLNGIRRLYLRFDGPTRNMMRLDSFTFVQT